MASQPTGPVDTNRPTEARGAGRPPPLKAVRRLASEIASDPQRRSHPDEAAAGLAAAPPPPDLIGSLRPLIRSLLPAGCPGVALVARLCGLSLRSFQRELAAAGLSFSDLVEQARLELALALMRDPAMPLTEVALELGYSDSANFTRAFRRWTGLAPRRYRQVVNSGEPPTGPPASGTARNRAGFGTPAQSGGG
jgi:AraC-like DNA-binding protein